MNLQNIVWAIIKRIKGMQLKVKVVKSESKYQVYLHRLPKETL